MSIKTPNYNLIKPADNETADIQVINGNMDAIDAALTPTADSAQIPEGNGPWKLSQWVNWLTNRIKAITGKANWWDAPSKTLEDLNTHLAEITVLIPKAGSTANAILLDFVFGDKKKGSFLATANNTGSVTINGKPLKKNATTEIPSGGIKAGKVYDFYCDLSNNYFFLLAKASGTAQPSQVLAGYPYSNEDGEQMGAMPNKGVFNLPLGAAVPTGYYSGGTVPNGKKFATGTVSCTAYTQKTITGLDFTPSKIHIACNDSVSSFNSDFAFFSSIKEFFYMQSGYKSPCYGHTYISNGTGGSVLPITDTTQYSMSNGQFKFYPYATSEYKWFAWE